MDSEETSPSAIEKKEQVIEDSDSKIDKQNNTSDYGLMKHAENKLDTNVEIKIPTPKIDEQNSNSVELQVSPGSNKGTPQNQTDEVIDTGKWHIDIPKQDQKEARKFYPKNNQSRVIVTSFIAMIVLGITVIAIFIVTTKNYA